MKNLASVSVIKDILAASGFKFSKSLGQNFLIDENVLSKIVECSAIDKNSGVIEIGPGFGTLTQRLCMAAGKVVAIEIDKTAIPILEDNLSDFDNLKIINEDVLKCDLHKIIAAEFDGMDGKSPLLYYHADHNAYFGIGAPRLFAHGYDSKRGCNAHCRQGGHKGLWCTECGG